MSDEPERGSAIYRGRRALGAVGPRLAAIAIMLLFFASAGVAQSDDEGPFDILSGSWSGTGTIALSSGTKERIRCKAEYRVVTRTNVLLRHRPRAEMARACSAPPQEKSLNKNCEKNNKLLRPMPPERLTAP